MNEHEDYMNNEIQTEETVTVSKKYLKDLVQEIRVDYDEEFVPVDAIRSLALRTLYYLAND